MSPIIVDKSWVMKEKGSFDCLELQANIKLPDLADTEVLVKFHAASLNYRDLVMPLVCSHHYFIIGNHFQTNRAHRLNE
jgi:NADPH:quinone reductase-like Zn-dependent oxidoreductase